MATRLVNAIEKGIVIDHIRAGLGPKLYHYLKLDKADFTVVMITNAVSQRLGRKDIIKIQNIIDLDYRVIGLVDDGATISTIENGAVVEKKNMKLPQSVENVLHCKNPRCVTTIENVPHIFRLRDAGKRAYACIYCEETASDLEL